LTSSSSSYLSSEVILCLLDSFTKLKAYKAAEPDVLFDDRRDLGDILTYSLLVILDESLIQEANITVPLVELTSHDFLDDRVRLSLTTKLRGVDLNLLRSDVLRNLARIEIDGITRSDMHRDILDQGLEVIATSDEIRLAVDLDESADAPIVDVCVNRAFSSDFIGALSDRGEALLLEILNSLVHIAIGLN
jgi:hypothetical protein